jgi:tRNA pseudouridine55 synthase
MTTTDGIILIDKPIGPSSFDVVRKVRTLAGIKRVGHAGTLDPMASGLMVICLGRFTKLAGLLTDDDKVYETSFHIGIRTTTDDIEGKIIEERDCAHLAPELVLQTLASFRGAIMQAPPRFSAIKIEGQRAYARARADEDFELAQREVFLFDIVDVKINLPEVFLRLHCSKGFYVRSLARDLGDKLLVGAHAKSIKRLKSGSFSLTDAIAFDELTPEKFKSHVKRGRDSLSHLEIIDIDTNASREFGFGRNPCAGIALKSAVAVAVCGDDPVAILRNENGITKLARVL